MKRTMLALAAALSIMGCKKSIEGEESVLQASNKNTGMVQSTVAYDSNNPILKNANTDVLIGAAINDLEFYNSKYTNRAKTQYNSITAESEMKFHKIQAVQGKYVFADKTVKFIQDSLANKARMHGHALL